VFGYPAIKLLDLEDNPHASKNVESLFREIRCYGRGISKGFEH